MTPMMTLNPLRPTMILKPMLKSAMLSQVDAVQLDVVQSTSDVGTPSSSDPVGLAEGVDLAVRADPPPVANRSLLPFQDT
jgi:hypothetical protein